MEPKVAEAGQERAEAGRGQAEARRPLLKRAREAVGGSAWAPLGGKAAAYVAGFFALALVGSGEALRLLPGPGGGTGAEMALVYGAASTGGPTPGEPRPAEGGDAGAADTHAAADTHTAADAGAAADTAAGAATDGGAPGGGVTADGKVVLNLATAEDLRRLPGVGPAKAARILEVRAKLKRFRKVDDLLRVKGIGRRSLQRLRPLVLVDPPQP